MVVITTGNGLSTPAVIDTDGDGLADRAYAGDLKGNMWAFDLSGTNAGNWDVAYKQGQTVKPLFTAPANQPITGTPCEVPVPRKVTFTGLVLFAGVREVVFDFFRLAAIGLSKQT